MQLLNYVLLAVGIACLAVAFLRGREAWSRYRTLRDQEANVARYEAWRGGVRDRSPSSATFAMSMARRDVIMSFLIGLIGLGALIAGFFPA